jgi:HSP20 family protein
MRIGGDADRGDFAITRGVTWVALRENAPSAHDMKGAVMTVSGFDPFSTLDRVLSRMGTASGYGTMQNLSLPMDVYRKGDAFVIELDIPGVDPSAIDMAVEHNMLTVSGEVHPRHDDVDEVVVCERPHARFRRQVYLGENLDTEQIKANYENGVLRIRIPIAETRLARKIEISSEQGGEQAIDVGSGSTAQDEDGESQS